MLDARLAQKCLGLTAIKAGMHSGHVIDRIRNANPARQHRNVCDEGNIGHQTFAFDPGITAEHAKSSFVGDQSKNRVQRSSLAGSVGPDQSENAPFFHPQIDSIERNCCAKYLPEATCFDTSHDQRSSSFLFFVCDDVSFGELVDGFPFAPAFSNSSVFRPSRWMVA